MPRGDVENLHGLTQQSFTSSPLFARTFDEGMALVEETARYLDGKGRDDARALPRKAAILYAGESMRVTTRMMQTASWLLVQRAIQEGDMPPDTGASNRYRLGSREICLGTAGDGGENILPVPLRDLLARSESLYRRIARLDEILFGNAPPPVSGVQAQFCRLEQAFSGE